jgi:hypothetical protein
MRRNGEEQTCDIPLPLAVIRLAGGNRTREPINARHHQFSECAAMAKSKRAIFRCL